MVGRGNKHEMRDKSQCQRARGKRSEPPHGCERKEKKISTQEKQPHGWRGEAGGEGGAENGVMEGWEAGPSERVRVCVGTESRKRE